MILENLYQFYSLVLRNGIFYNNFKTYREILEDHVTVLHFNEVFHFPVFLECCVENCTMWLSNKCDNMKIGALI